MNDQSQFIRSALTDTGFMARHVIGFNYDKDEYTEEIIKPGGIRASGPYKKMTDFYDDKKHRRKHLEFPRGGYKTSGVQAFMIREATVDRNLRFLYGMETYSNALQSLDFIRQQFESNDKLKMVGGGDFKSPMWSREKFTISGRTRILKEPTFSAFGVDKVVTGGHYDRIILDDLVSWQNVSTSEGIDKVKRCLRMVSPLLDPGGILIVIGTRYHDEDLYAHIINNMGKHYKILIIDCGMYLEEGENGEVVLSGESIFPHLTKTFLQTKLIELEKVDFTSQYLNKCLSEGTALFRRSQFKTMKYDSTLEGINAYILTDTATSEREEGCYSVIAVVGLDNTDNAYLFDLRVGHKNPSAYADELLEVQDEWAQRVNIKGILMEKIAMNQVFHAMLQENARQRGMRIRIIDVARGTGEPSKKQRIQRLHGRMSKGRFYVMDSVPTLYHDLGKQKTLWDPEGFKTEDGSFLPEGELVMEFIRFPVYGKNDIPDALADIDAMDRNGSRLCHGSSLVQARRTRSRRVRKGQIIPIPMTVNGRETLVDITPSSNHGRDDFWQGLRGRIGGQ